MTTYSKKYFNEETQKWEPLYSTEGRSAYETAKLNGYTGTEEEFNKAFSAPESLELEYAPPMEPVKPEPVKQTKVKAKPARDEWTLDLFGGVA